MSRFWEWAVAAYARPGVEAICLELQDKHEQCVPLLLFGGWAEAVGLGLDEEAVEAAADTARVWSEQVIAPLRIIRRRLKGPVGDMDAVDKDAIRQQVKDTELAAEQALMRALEGLAQPCPVSVAKAAHMEALARAWSAPLPREGLRRLRDALSDNDFLRYN